MIGGFERGYRDGVDEASTDIKADGRNMYLVNCHRNSAMIENSLNEEKWEMLNEQQIRQFIIGKSISPKVDSGWPDFRETFNADGQWRSSFARRGPTMMFGKWSMDGDKLCVSVERKKPLSLKEPYPKCRNIWKNSSEDIFKLIDLMSDGRHAFVMINDGYEE